MATETCQIIINGLPVQIDRKAIKNLHLGVYPPEGRVRVAAPLAVSNHAVRLAVIGKLPWIRRQMAKFEAQSRQSEREMVRGESHYFMGRRYRLRIILGIRSSSVVVLNSSAIELHVRDGADANERERILQKWYRVRLKDLATPLLNKWQSRLGVQASAWGIKKMKTKWGSCNVGTRRVWLNLELIKKPVKCLEYLVVHELAHLLEPQHNDRFITILDEHLPSWRTHRKTLNSAPLSNERWSY